MENERQCKCTKEGMTWIHYGVRVWILRTDNREEVSFTLCDAVVIGPRSDKRLGDGPRIMRTLYLSQPQSSTTWKEKFPTSKEYKTLWGSDRRVSLPYLVDDGCGTRELKRWSVTMTLGTSGGAGNAHYQAWPILTVNCSMLSWWEPTTCTIVGVLLTVQLRSKFVSPPSNGTWVAAGQ